MPVTSSQAGKDYDNQVAREVNDLTDDSVRAHSCRGSGNVAWPECDVIVRTPQTDYAVEAKKTSGPETVLVDGTKRPCVYYDAAELEQLVALHNDYTLPLLCVKFTRRGPLVVPVMDSDHDTTGMVRAQADDLSVSDDPDWSFAVDVLVDTIAPAFDPHWTGQSLRLVYPTTDEWASARSAPTAGAVIADVIDHAGDEHVQTDPFW